MQRPARWFLGQHGLELGHPLANRFRYSAGQLTGVWLARDHFERDVVQFPRVLHELEKVGPEVAPHGQRPRLGNRRDERGGNTGELGGLVGVHAGIIAPRASPSAPTRARSDSLTQINEQPATLTPSQGAAVSH